jgi:hypothetical protein
MTSIRLPYVQEYRDRHGKARRYFRRPGFKRVTLHGTPGSPQFMAAYQAALAAERPPIGRKHNDGTVGDLVVSFYRSAAFDNLKASSQRAYRKILDPLAEKDGHRLVRDMPRRVAVSIIEEIGTTRPGAANLTLKVMRPAVCVCDQERYAGRQSVRRNRDVQARHIPHMDRGGDRSL